MSNSPPEPAPRVRLPPERTGSTRKFKITYLEDGKRTELKIYAIPNIYPDGQLGELFLEVDRQAAMVSGLLNALATSVSIGLQYGIPVDVYCSKFIATQFPPAGFTGDEELPSCTSVIDLIFRWLRKKFVKAPDEIPETTTAENDE